MCAEFPWGRHRRETRILGVHLVREGSMDPQRMGTPGGVVQGVGCGWGLVLSHCCLADVSPAPSRCLRGKSGAALEGSVVGTFGFLWLCPLVGR